MLLSRKDSFSSCWKKANFVPHLSAFSFVCYWQFLQIPNAAKLVTQQFLPPSFILNCFSAYQSQVCWKPSQKNLLIQKKVGEREGAGRRNYFHSISNSSCQKPHLAHAIILPTCTKCPSSFLQVIQGSTVDQKLQTKASSIVSFNETTVPENAVLPNSSPKGKEAPRLHFFCNSAQCFTWQRGRRALNAGSADSHMQLDCSYCHRIMDLFRLEEISRIIRPNH